MTVQELIEILQELNKPDASINIHTDEIIYDEISYDEIIYDEIIYVKYDQGKVIIEVK